MSEEKVQAVPHGTDDPIGYLLEHGWSRSELAVSWNLSTTNVIAKYQSGETVPRYYTAELMAKSFGWQTAGQVLDFYAALRRATAEAKDSKAGAA